MSGQGWTKELVGYVDGKPIVGARCPWCHSWLVPCRKYGTGWHADGLAIQFHSFSCPARPQKERKRPWREGRRRGPNAMHTLAMLYRDVDPNTPRDMLPDEMSVILAAGLAKVDASRIRQLCRSGELDARKGPTGYGDSVGWLVDTPSLLGWMVRTGRRAAGA